MHLLILLLSLSLVQCQYDIQKSAQQDVVKTKRGITLLPTGALISGPSFKPSLLYPDTAPSASASVYTNPKTLYSIQQNTQIRPILVPDSPKPFQYDQYPPHDQPDAQPNLSETTQPQVVFNQPQHRLNHFVNNPAILQPQPNQYHGAQTVVTPIQHSTYIHHTPYTIPGGSPQTRYYLAGQMYYNQKHPLAQQKVNPSAHAQSYQRVQFPQKAPRLHYEQQKYPQNLNNVAPIQFGQQITHHGYHKPESQREDKEEEQAEEQEEQEEEEESGKQQEAEEDDEEGVEEKEELKEDEEENEEAEEDDERPARYNNNEEQQEEEEEEEERNPFSKYQALDEPELERYEEEAAEDDEDNDGGSSYQVHKNKKKSQKYHSKAPKYEFYDRFHYKPSVKHVIKTKPVKPVKAYSTKNESKFGGYKSNNKSKSKPAKLDNNSKQSENVPIAVHKFYKEKWYLAKENIK